MFLGRGSVVVDSLLIVAQLWISVIVLFLLRIALCPF